MDIQMVIKSSVKHTLMAKLFVFQEYVGVPTKTGHSYPSDYVIYDIMTYQINREHPESFYKSSKIYSPKFLHKKLIFRENITQQQFCHQNVATTNFR